MYGIQTFLLAIVMAFFYNFESHYYCFFLSFTYNDILMISLKFCNTSVFKKIRNKTMHQEKYNLTVSIIYMFTYVHVHMYTVLNENLFLLH